MKNVKFICILLTVLACMSYTALTCAGQNNSDAAARPAAGRGITAGMRGDRKAKIETDADIIAAIAESAGKFQQFVFADAAEGIELEYSLYIPENYNAEQKYPLLLYIPDASAASKRAGEIVEQYYGAAVWATASEQSKHAAFVLVPAFPTVAVDDSWNTTPEVAALVRLLEYLPQAYSIDRRRMYTTGQSMGCMISLYLNSKYPDLFAASLFVSGQWDINALRPLEQKKFFYITAGGDTKASGGQDALKEMFDADGVGYSCGSWSAQAALAEQNAAAAALIAQGHKANMIRFTAGSVLSGSTGMEHNASFNYGYKIEAVRDWLFAQAK